MAYNPFNIFRRNQKAIFAVVTVIIMFVFVLSSGLGGGADFFDWLPRWLGSKSKKGDVICKIDGEKIYASELSGNVGGLHNKRVMANRYMLGAAKEAYSTLAQFEDQQLSQISDPETRRVLIQGAQAADQLRMFQMLRGNPQFAPRLQQLEKLAADYASLVTSPTAKPIEKEIVRARQYREMIEEVLKFSRDELYFFNAPNRSQNDLIDFMLWQRKADQLGITFTTKDIKELIEKEFYQNFKSDVAIRAQLRQLAGFNMDDCLAAIGEEFRVRTAQAAVLGPAMVYMRGDKTFGGTTNFSSPFEVFEYYRDQCSPTDYLAFSIPAAGFVDQVKLQPQERELERLFDQYKDDEPNPAKETPGFKIPRLVKLEWISASGAEPYYVKMAEESLRAGELQAKFGSLMTIPLAGVGPGWIASATGALAPKDPLLELDGVRSEYNSLVKDHHNNILENDWLRPSFVTELQDTSTVRPQTLVSALGGIVGGSMTLAGPITGVETFQTAVRVNELRDRIIAGAPTVFGAVPLPGMFGTMLGGQAATQSLLPKPLPIEVVKPELMKHLAEQTTKQLVLNDLKTFSTKVAELSENGNAKDKGPVTKYIAEFIASRGLQHGMSDKLRSEWTLEEDPGLAPLREVLNKSPHGNAVIQFGKKFFWSDEARSGQRNPVSGTYKPEYYPNEPSSAESPMIKPEPKFLVWRTEETKAKKISDFPLAEEQVRAAWKKMKARDIARNRADTIANQMQSSAGDVPELIDQNLREMANVVRNSIADPKIRERVKVFSIPGVCPLTGPEFGGGLHPFELRPSSDITYPTKAMTETLLTQRTKPPKTSFVLVDEPKDNYYVVTLKDRKVKSEQDFQFSVFMEFSTGMMAGGLGQTRQAVMGSFTRDTTKKTMESVMGLLKKQFKFEISDEQKQKLEDKDKGGIEQ
jgi:hypothetical protein